MSDELRDRIIAALRTVKEPELPVNLYDLGLIYDLEVDGSSARIRMTLTTPNCPVAESMPGQVQKAVEGVDGIDHVEVALVWEPPWSSERMSEDARMTLDMMGISWKDPKDGPRFTDVSIGRKGLRD